MVHISLVDVRGCVLEVKVYTLHTCMTYTSLRTAQFIDFQMVKT